MNDLENKPQQAATPAPEPKAEKAPAQKKPKKKEKSAGGVTAKWKAWQVKRLDKAGDPAPRKKDTLKKTVKNSESALPAEQRDLLTYSNDLLVPCTLAQQPDSFELSFAVRNLSSIRSTLHKGLTRAEQLRLLVNCADLAGLAESYVFAMDPSNLYYDYNLHVRALMRDIGERPHEEFLQQYRALAGAVLQPKYQFADYMEGGDDLYAKMPLLQAVAEKKTVEELRDFLMKQYNQERRTVSERKKVVWKSHSLAARIAIPVLGVCIVGLGVLSYFAYFRTLPFRTAQLKASDDYVAGQYISCTEALKNYPVEELPFASRFVLARSFVITEGLTDTQRDHVLATLTQTTEDAVVNFWIEVGRENFDAAVDYAQRLGDDELLLFALIKQDVVVTDDATMTGEDKAAKLKEIEQKIKELQEKMGTQEKEMTEASQEGDAAGTTDAAAGTTDAAAGTAAATDAAAGTAAATDAAAGTTDAAAGTATTATTVNTANTANTTATPGTTAGAAQ